MSKNQKNISFWTAFLPVGSLLALIILGLFVAPFFTNGKKAVPVEVIFIMGSAIAITQLVVLGHRWEDIMKSIVAKLSKAIPTLLILLAIGLIIGSWIVSGTIPMLVYYGIKLIHPDYIYAIAFVVPAIFSTFTGTSWGSASTIGIVLMGVAMSIEADLAITAGAVIGGSFFGDKLSPLSDTTNVAAMAVEVKLMDHIKSMLYTTIPAAIVAIGAYLVLGFVFPAKITTVNSPAIEKTLTEISSAFNFNVLLLLPPIMVLYGSIKKLPTLPVLVIASLAALIFAFLFQDFDLFTTLNSAVTGFDTSAIGDNVSVQMEALFNRGGIYGLSGPLIVSILAFVFVGTIDRINAMPIIVNTLFGFVNSAGGLVRSVLISTGITNAMTSNQYATSFIIGDAFTKKFDDKGIDRKVLSRSIEDTGTLIESLIPWHQSAIFMTGTLGVTTSAYWYWQFFSLSNIFIAFLYTFIGFAIFKVSNKKKTA